jgi:TonB family protein
MRQAVQRLVLSLTFSALAAFAPTANAAITPTTSPVAPIQRNGHAAENARRINAKAHAARLARAAICTEDISQIKFQEYYVDWSVWMNEVGDRWSTVFNSAYNNGKFHTDGPAFVQFTCKADGSITDVVVAQGSGDRMCDRSQVEALVNCMPLPAFPVGSARKTVTLLYVWEYGKHGHIAKSSAPAARTTSRSERQTRTAMPDSYRTSVTGKLM